MTETNWSRVEGMMICPHLDPMKLAHHLKREAVLAQIEWYDASPHLVGIRVAWDGQFVATLSRRGKELKPGPTLESLVEELATKFHAEVMLGDVAVDKIRGDQNDVLSAKRKKDDTPIRVIEIGTTPSSAVPLMAAFEGVDIAELELPDGKRLMAAQLPAHRAGWYFGDVPLVTLVVQGDEFQAHFMADDDPEGAISYNWGMNEVVIAGAQGWDGAAAQTAHALVGSRPEIEAIHDAVPGVDVEVAFEASQLRGPAAVSKFVEALGLNADISEYLLGENSLDEIAGARVHRARGISNAIGRSVDMIIDERQGESPFWESYTNIVRTRPWLVPLIASVEASAGVGLLAISRKREDGQRSKMGKFGTVIGSLLLMDSISELTLAKYTVWRAERREAREKEVTLSLKDAQ